MIKPLLTEKQNQVFAYILGYISDYGYSPMREEISSHFKITNQSAQYFLNVLVKYKKIKLIKNKKRNIKII